MPEHRLKKNFEKIVKGAPRSGLPSTEENYTSFCIKTENDLLGVFLYEHAGKARFGTLSSVLWMQMDMALALRQGLDEAIEAQILKTGGRRLYESEVGEFPDSSFGSKRLTWEELGPVLQSKYEDRAQKLGIVEKEEWPEV